MQNSEIGKQKSRNSNQTLIDENNIYASDNLILKIELEKQTENKIKSLKDQIINLSKERNDLKATIINGKLRRSNKKKAGLRYIGESSNTKEKGLYHVQTKKINNMTPPTH